MTGCDDGIVRGWDLATAKQLFTLRGSADYVRSQASSPASRHIWAAGSYDGRARIYDLRTRDPVFTIAHGAQVDKIILLPGGARAVTIGGPSVKVWDFFSGGKCVGELECHAKAVTCGAVAENGKKLLTGGLDGMVKVHDMGSLELVSTIPCRGQVLSLAVGPDDSHVAAGLVDGTVDVRGKVSGRAAAVVKMPDSGYGDEPTFVPQETGALKERLFEGWGRGFKKTKAKKKTANPGSMRYFMRGQNSKLTDARDVVVKKRRRTGLKEHDVMLRKFAYGRALDSVLVEGKWKPRTTRLAVGLIEELIARDGLRTALAGRSADGLVPILRLINSKIGDPEFSVLLCHVTNVVLDLYGGIFGQGERRDAVDALLFKIQQKVKREIVVIRQLCSLQGMLEMIPSA